MQTDNKKSKSKKEQSLMVKEDLHCVLETVGTPGCNSEPIDGG